MELKNLKSLAEAAGSQSNASKASKIFIKLEDDLEKAYEAVDAIRKSLQSDVLADLLKQEGFPATESKAAKEAINAAYDAVKKAYNEVTDLHMAVGMHFQRDDNDD